MNIATTPTQYTPEDLLTLPDGKNYELVHGHLVEKQMGFDSSYVAGEIVALLKAFARTGRPGWVLSSDAGYQCFPDDPDKVRKPDASYISLERLPANQKPTGHCRIAPDLAVEVISPNDLALEVDHKVSEYRSAGVRLVWVVNPQEHTVEVHRLTGPGTILGAADDLTGEDVLPGFRCRVADLFLPPAPAPRTDA
jgi:Uma2 family endonuclease